MHSLVSPLPCHRQRAASWPDPRPAVFPARWDNRHQYRCLASPDAWAMPRVNHNNGNRDLLGSTCGGGNKGTPTIAWFPVQDSCPDPRRDIRSHWSRSCNCYTARQQIVPQSDFSRLGRGLRPIQFPPKRNSGSSAMTAPQAKMPRSNAPFCRRRLRP